ncbi:MAG: hypothetical protein U5R31_13735 [Acidimicrobiia bacterium]|nr:hypothetical protein [Acidimicrobiia bacterium]
MPATTTPATVAIFTRPLSDGTPPLVDVLEPRSWPRASTGRCGTGPGGWLALAHGRTFTADMRRVADELRRIADRIDADLDVLEEPVGAHGEMAA